MADISNELIFETLKSVQAEVAKMARKQHEGVARFDKIDQRLDEIHETMYATAGYAVHANVRHDSVASELADIRQRLAKLEENA